MKIKLLSFSVSNFRGFNAPIVFSLDRPSDYQFQEDLIRENVVNDAIIYGCNGAGKSSLCRALADIVAVLTDLYVSSDLVNNLNYGCSLNPLETVTAFSYKIQAGEEIITYDYQRNRTGLLSERLSSNGKTIISYDLKKAFIDRSIYPEIQALDLVGAFNRQISFVKYLARSGIEFKTKAIRHIVQFAESLLVVRSLISGPQFVGFSSQGSSLTYILKQTDSLRDFEEFLNENNIHYNLEIEETNDPTQPKLIAKFPYERRDFFDIASTGTVYLLLLFTWVKVIGNKASVFVIDEFDAYYHDDTAKNVFSILRKLDCQVIITTHRTSLMQNSIARPDCVFILRNNAIKPLPELTDRELREANNIEKLYRSGAFTE